MQEYITVALYISAIVLYTSLFVFYTSEIVLYTSVITPKKHWLPAKLVYIYRRH